MGNQTSGGGGGAGAPKTAKYILQTADARLANAQALGALSTGFAYVTTSTGVISTVGESGAGNVVRATSPTIVTPTIAKLANLTTNGFVKTSAGDGTLSVDTATYLTGNQTITLSGDASGSGATAIAVTLATVTVGKGGTGATSLTAHAALIGNGTSAVATLAPGTARNVMISDGTDWASRALVAADIPTLTLAKISDAGTSASQNANNVAISGGTINGTVIGGSSAAALTATTIANNSTITNTQSIAATSTDGLILTNVTAAAAGAQQWSPRIRLTGQGWKTTATAASQTVDWIIENQPIQGAANPTTNLVFSAQVNGGGYSGVLTLASGGATISATTPNIRIDDGANGSGFIGQTAGALIFSANRNPQTGTFVNVNLAMAGIQLSAGNGDGNIRFYTTSTNNSAPLQRLFISSTGVIALNQGIIAPTADSTTALRLTKADGTTAVVTVNTTNSILLIQGSTGTALDVTAGTNAAVFRNAAGTAQVWISAAGQITIGAVAAQTAVALQVNPGYIGTTTVGLQINGASAADIIQVKNSAAALVQTTAVDGTVTQTGRDAATTTVTNTLILDHATSGTPGTGFGTGLAFQGQSSTTASRSMGRIRTAWTTATDASRASNMVLSVYNVGTEVDVLTLANASATVTGLLTSNTLSVTNATGANAIGGSTIGGAILAVGNTATSDFVKLAVRGSSGQTADLQQWQSNTPTTLVKIGANGVFYPVQAPTASAPTYVEGGIYYDTTLHKLRVGGASGWETITSS